jgi:hypothetical protein
MIIQILLRLIWSITIIVVMGSLAFKSGQMDLVQSAPQAIQVTTECLCTVICGYIIARAVTEISNV